LPSLPDLTDLDAEFGAPVQSVGGPAAPSDVLARVKAEGLRRRTRRHRRNGVLAALGLALVAMPAIALLPGEDRPEGLTVAADPDREPATTIERPEIDGPITTAVTTVAPPTTVVDPTQTSLGPATTIERDVPPPTTVPAGPTCRNSTDPACGDFRWDPQPAPNQAITAAFVDAPQTVTAGEAATFTVAWSDPDAPLEYDNFSADGVGLAMPCAMEPRYGPWTPPDAVAGSGELTYTHTFTEPGTYTVVVSIGTGQCGSPYADTATRELTVTVV